MNPGYILRNKLSNVISKYSRLKRLFKLWPFHKLEMGKLDVHWIWQPSVITAICVAWFDIKTRVIPTKGAIEAYQKYKECMDAIDTPKTRT